MNQVIGRDFGELHVGARGETGMGGDGRPEPGKQGLIPALTKEDRVWVAYRNGNDGNPPSRAQIQPAVRVH